MNKSSSAQLDGIKESQLNRQGVLNSLEEG
jgi:hypothetical protein